MGVLAELETLSGSAAQRRLEATVSDFGGVLPLAPCWVPRDFLQPGRRLKLASDDLYAFGPNRGGIDERWLASTVEAENPGRQPDEGLSYCVLPEGKVLLRDAVALCKSELIGERLWSEYERWPVLSKFFDNSGLIPLHLHQNDEQAQRVGAQAKPEAYFFPEQLNPQPNSAPVSFFGLAPDVTKDQLRDCLERWETRDNHALRLSLGYELETGTGWSIPPGILHAPGSLCTYEPQWASDVTSMYQNVVEGRYIRRDLLVSNVPESHRDDLDYLVEQVDWAANQDPRFKEKRRLVPIPIEGSESEGYLQRWIVYGDFDGVQRFTAKELTVQPSARCVVREPGAFGLVCIQGHGAINNLPLGSPTLMRYGHFYDDEYFCSESAARIGIAFENRSLNEPLVCLLHFGPNAQPDAPLLPQAAKA